MAAAEISPSLVAKFEKLGARWKSLLPRLTKAGAGTNGAAKPARKRAPSKVSSRRRRA
jgi:hypothetical protein